ncbi:MAG: glycoside hydrolase family 88 protein [Prevotellaceae bacterium]|jgi:predicted alpha-1,6-mannanase (GH76 family)|nr:glycoside hydrolase family 88 protein [Prevotellaceae bacterium]
MKKIAFILTVMLLIVACGQVDDVYYPRPAADTGTSNTDPDPEPVPTTYWANAADSAISRLLSAFWNEGNGYFRMSFTPPATQGTGFQYWPQAHALDAVIDAYIRTGDTRYSDYYTKWFNGVRIGNGAKWSNNYIDDMEWIVLTMLRMYETSQNQQYLTTARQIYDDWIITQWSDTPGGGGILWCTTANPSKNACSNGPAGIAACRLYNLVTDDPTAKAKYRADAERIYAWLKAVLITASYDVADNINQNNVVGGTSLSYNVGTVLGTAHELYKITGTKAYLDDAVRLATRATTNGAPMNQAAGILRSEGTGDGGLFKGIFIRYFVKLINDTNVEKAVRQQFHTFMVYNATTLWTSGTTKEGDYQSLFSDNWNSARTSGTAGCQEHVSGCTLLEAMNVLQPVE